MKKMMLLGTAVLGLAAIGHADNKSAPMNQMECSMLGDQEQTFANKLNAANKTTFCKQFTASQRSRAMQMANQKGSNGSMTPDAAVQKVMQEDRMSPAKGATGGGCPVK